MNIQQPNYELFNWKTNPFVFKIIPDLFTGYQQEVNQLVTGLQNGSKFSLLMGPTGSGKTTLLKYVVKTLGSTIDIIYLPKPPSDPKDLVDIFRDHFNTGFLNRLFKKKDLNLYNVSQYINEKIGSKKFILFIDECHEASINTLEWLRVLTDQIDNLYIVFAGLPTFDKTLHDNLETLLRRISLKISLGNLSKSETKDLIKRRIEYFGGEDIKPFTFNSIDLIYQKTGGFPREVIRICDNVVKKAIDSNISMIDSDLFSEEDSQFQRASTESLEELPHRQKVILDVLSKHGSLTPSDIVKKINPKEYKTKDNAIRSVNNLLRRLMKEELVVRKKKGKAYKYEVTNKIKTMMVSA